MRDAIVIGAGIIGATVSLALRKQGLDVLTLDDGRPLSGTAPSGGHLKPSWFGGMKKEEYEPAMELLDSLWGLIEEDYLVGDVTEKVYRVDTDQVLASPRTIGKVTAVEHLNNFPLVKYNEISSRGLHNEIEERCRLLVLAAGTWCWELLPNFPVKPKQGISFRFRGKLEQPFIKPWAPYKQIVAHQQAKDQIWIGDGTAIIPANWNIARTRQSTERCRVALEPSASSPLEIRMGYRPYCETANGDPCLLQRIGPRAWVATGAGKSGTIAAGWVARRILNAL